MNEKILIVLLCSLSFTLAKSETLNNSFNQSVTLAWDYPTNYWQGVQQTFTAVTNTVAAPAVSNMTYYLYTTTILSGTNTPWNLIGFIVNPPIQTNANGSLFHSITVPVLYPPQSQYFALMASNVLGKSFFSGPAATPPAPPFQGSFQILSTR